MKFKIDDLSFHISIADQEMKFEVEHKTEPLAQAVAATCGPTNKLGALRNFDYRLDFKGDQLFNELREQLIKFVEEIKRIDAES